MSDSVNKKILLCNGFYGLQSVTSCFRVLSSAAAPVQHFCDESQLDSSSPSLCLTVLCLMIYSSDTGRGWAVLYMNDLEEQLLFCCSVRSVCKLQLLFSPVPPFLWRKVWAIHVAALWLSLATLWIISFCDSHQGWEQIPWSYRLLWFSS